MTPALILAIVRWFAVCARADTLHNVGDQFAHGDGAVPPDVLTSFHPSRR